MSVVVVVLVGVVDKRNVVLVEFVLVLFVRVGFPSTGACVADVNFELSAGGG